MKILILCALSLIAISCAPHPKAMILSSADQSFQKAADEYVAGYLAHRPEGAVSLGFHQFDGKPTDTSFAAISDEHTRQVAFRKKFAAMNGTKLAPEMEMDRRVLLTAIDGDLLSFEVMRPFARNPMTYASVDLTGYAKRNFAAKPHRMKSAIQILEHVPQMMADARANLEEHLPRTFVTTAIEQANGTADFLTSDLLEAFADVKDEGLQSQLKQKATDAAGFMRRYATWLKEEKLPRSTNDFAIGRAAYVRMLHDEELLDESPEQILTVAMRELKREQEKFAAAAKIIDPNHSAIEVYRSIQKDHPTEQSLIPDTVKHLEMIRDYIVKHDIVTIPSEVRVKVEETPRFDRATSFASMDSPGPFEKASEAFYYVTPTEPNWTPQHKEEWLTAFNYYATDVTSIHESYPGHYVQFLHQKASNGSRVSKIFGSYAYTEGWAHYCEQMLVDDGFPEGADQMTAAKYRLEQSDQALLRLCRLCCSVMMHTRGMTAQGATKFFMNNCYYEEAPAKAEAERGTYDPGYAFYTLGKLQILKLREDYKNQEGENFSQKKFHDMILDHGAPPIRLLREMMLKDQATWSQALPQ